MNLFILLLIIILIYLLNLKTVNMNKVQKYHGRFTRNLADYEFVVPHKTTENGDFLSFYLNSYYTHDYKSRRRRDDSNIPSVNRIYYNIFFNGKNHLLELTPNHGFISPSMISEFHYPGSGEKLTTRHIKKQIPALCHYTGSIRDHDGSTAALSLCDGLIGYLKTNDGIFFIEPAEGHGANELGHHLHLVHKQDDLFNKNKKETSKRMRTDDDEDNDEDDADDDAEDETEAEGAEDTVDESIVVDDKIDDISSSKLNRQCESFDWNEGWAKAFQNLYEGKLSTQYANADSTTYDISDDMKREVNDAHKFLEVLVVADKKFLDYHRDKDYENYILTIMNMVSDFYHDCSIGQQLDVVIVRIIYLDKEIEALDVDISPDAYKTIDSFCKWQNDINPKDPEHPHHHDTAVLLTRHDICVDENQCNLLGLAHLAAACSPRDSCAITEDTGLMLGVVVAHELGHIVGCDHDDKSSSGCEPKADETFFHVMAPYVSMATTKWSSCSRKFVSELFKNNLGQCLMDEPKESPYKEPEMLAGAIYDADYQCRLLYSPSSSHCPRDEHEFCEKLFCRVDANKCRSNGDPPADGTKCGFNKWCFRKNCVGIGARALASKSGEWEEWGPYCECSKSCGGGIQVSTRECKNTENGGAYCIGERHRLKICNTQPCPLNEPSFRSQQCCEYNNVKHHNKLFKWQAYLLPNVDSDANCALYCINEEGAYSKLAPRVKDGTLCEIGTNNMCVGGFCKKVGCDWIFDSEAIEDKCGICNGNGQGCKHKNGTYTKICTGYKRVKKLPIGAKNVRITELGPSENMIAIGCKDGNKMFLNQNNKQDCDGAKELNGNIAMYTHLENDREELFLPGPLTRALYFFVAFVKEENVGYNYEYYTKKKNCPRDGNTPQGCYRWDFVEFGHCSARCGGGEAVSHPVCVMEGEGEVGSQFCENLIKPEPKVKVCNIRECKISWHVGDWGKCCGCVHKAGTQKRKVWCAKESSHWEEHDVLEENCACAKADGPKPCDKQLCVCNCEDGNCPARRKRNFSISKKASQLTTSDFIKLFQSINTMLDEKDNKVKTYVECPSCPPVDSIRIRKCPPKVEPVKPCPKKSETIKDSLCVPQIVSIDAPLRMKSISKVSDEAFEKLGETLTGNTDLSHAQICHGEKARERLYGKYKNKSQKTCNHKPKKTKKPQKCSSCED